MPPKRTAATVTPATPMTDAQIRALISQGVVDAKAKHDADRSANPLILRALKELRVKFATCTLLGNALTWWNSHVKTVGHTTTYGMPWKTLMKMMADKYCPRGEVKKLEIEIWNLKVKGIDVGSVMASKPKTMQEAIDIANDLMDQKIRTLAERQAKNKRKPILQGMGKRNHTEDLNLCVLNATITMMDNVLPSAPTARGLTIQPGTIEASLLLPTTTREPKGQIEEFSLALSGNHGGNGNVVARAYVVRNDERNPNSNVVTGTFLLNNRYASILFDTGGDRSFVSTAFSSLIDIIPTTLDYSINVKLANGRIIWVNTLIWGCTLNLLNHPFNIDLMPVEMGSFDFIIAMGWLSKYHAMIVYDEKIIHIPFGNEILIVRGDGSNNGNESRLNIISCTKTQKYLLKGCHVVLAHATTKKAEDKSEEKRLKDVQIVQDFPEVFLEDFQGIPPA
ncbi:putative reverse transcriptase domain-containing protein, partial [Tanacetum coccineum]